MTKSLSADTTPEAQQLLFELARRATVWKRLKLTCELIQTTRLLALADLRRRHPLADENDLRRRLALRLLGCDHAARAFGYVEAAGED